MDDSQVNRLMTSRMLADFVVETVASAEEALTRVREVDFDLVLMDCQLPGMDGFEATRQIRRLEAEQPGDRRVPVVALTAHAAATMRERCLAAGMDDYLAKPFKRDQLQQVCLRWLDR